MELQVGDTIKCYNLWEMQKVIAELGNEGIITKIVQPSAYKIEVVEIMKESEI